VLASSNSGSLVNFSAGTKFVFCDYPAGRAVYLDTATNVTIPGLTLSNGTANGVLYLNGSKVATSGSTLTFDGTYFTANGLRLAGADVTNTIYQATGALGISTGSASGITFYTNLANRYQIDATGVAVWSVGGSESMRLNSTGLGIGTASPATTLHVNGLGGIFSQSGFNYATVSQLASSADAVFGGGVIADTVGGQLKKTVANDGNFIRLQISDGIAFHTGATGAAGSTFARTSFERMRLTAAGDLGIGTASPANYANYRNLAISGTTGANIDMLSGSTKVGNLFNDATNFYAYNVIAGSLVFGTNNTERMRLDSAGRFLLGASSNTSRGGSNTTALFYKASGTQYLDIQTGTSGDSGLLFSATSSSAYGLINYSNSVNAMLFYANSAEVFRITSSGLLGLGTTSPAAKLHVVNSTPNSGRPTALFDANYGNAGDTVTGLRLNVNTGAGGGYQWGYSTEFVLAHNMEFISGSNYVARATTASYLQQIGGEFVFFSNQSLTAGNTFTPTERMRLNSSGNLGIGTASPATRLHVDSSATNTTVTVESEIDGGSLFTSGLSLIRAGTVAGSRIQALRDASVGGVGLNFLTTADNAAEISGTLTSRMVLDRSGNLGLGVTPSAWGSGNRFLDVNASASYGAFGSTDAMMLANAFWNGSNWVRKNANNAFRFVMESVNSAPTMSWQVAANSTAGSTISWTQAMTLDASGNLGVGVTSPTVPIEVQSNSGGTGIIIRGRATANSGTLRFYANNGTTQQAKFEANDTTVEIGSITNVPLLLYANGSERARIDSSGRFLVGYSTNQDGSVFQFDANSVGSTVYTGRIVNSSTSTSVYNAVRWLQGAAGSAVGYVGTGGSAVGNPSFQNNFVVGTQNSNALVFNTNDIERMRITSGGNVGIAEGNNPTQALSLYRSGSTNAIMSAGNSNTGLDGTWFGVDTVGNGIVNVRGAFPLLFSTSALERARITSGGKLLVGTTTAGYGLFTAQRVTINPDNDGIVVAPLAQNLSAYTVQANNDTGTRYALYIANGSSTAVGTISFTSAATAYNTSSDRRLKDNIAPADDAGSVIDAIEVVKHDWKVGGHTRYGMIAQDLHMVAPEAVSVGDADDVEDFKNPWGVDYSKLVPMLVKEIQSLRQRVAQLEVK